MGAATDIGVIRDHVYAFYRYLWHAAYDRIYLQRPGAPSVRRAAAKEDQGGLDDFVHPICLGQEAAV